MKSRAHLTLSLQEFIVFNALAYGMRSIDIAKLMNLSIKTVSTYRSRMLAKLGASNNYDLFEYARNNAVPRLKM